MGLSRRIDRTNGGTEGGAGSGVGDRAGELTNPGYERPREGDKAAVDCDLASLSRTQFEVLVLPEWGSEPGLAAAISQAASFVQPFVTRNKRVAASCHPWTLIEADGVRGLAVCLPGRRYGQTWKCGPILESKPITVDGTLVTPRRPDDLAACCRETVKAVRLGSEAESCLTQRRHGFGPQVRGAPSAIVLFSTSDGLSLSGPGKEESRATPRARFQPRLFHRPVQPSFGQSTARHGWSRVRQQFSRNAARSGHVGNTG
jgi:hypothetical protein